ncbi:MAG: DUF444 family protein [Myxococcales bacterium]|nr:DUF444 family protein [Myxococcales bacterium]
MTLNIDQDVQRFRNIVKGRVRKDLKKFMSDGEMIGKQGDKYVKIPLPSINIPRLRYGKNESGGVGQGEGEGGEEMPGEGQKAGNQPGEHEVEAEVSLEELAQILGEELQLPRIEPRGKKQIAAAHDRYTGIARIGPNALRHTRRTFQASLQRQIAGGTWDPSRPMLVPTKEDMRFRSWKSKQEPQSSAAILYVMDVSGSMGKEQKEIVRLEAFWIDTWLKANYKHLEARYLIHDAAAREVDRDTFFRVKESGGTLISSAYALVERLISEHYPPEEWNLYVFQFSDGDNWSSSDTKTCMDMLRTRILPKVNLFAYGQVESEYGSGQFFQDIAKEFNGDERVAISRIPDRGAIMGSIRDFLGKGR